MRRRMVSRKEVDPRKAPVARVIPLLASPQGGVAASSRKYREATEADAAGVVFLFVLIRKTAPASLSADASRHFIDCSATPPCGECKEGNARDSNSFTPSQTAQALLRSGRSLNVGHILVVLLADVFHDFVAGLKSGGESQLEWPGVCTRIMNRNLFNQGPKTLSGQRSNLCKFCGLGWPREINPERSFKSASAAHGGAA